MSLERAESLQIAGTLFWAAAMYLASLVPSVQVAWVTGILLFTITICA
jgi:hypothetical protein